MFICAIWILSFLQSKFHWHEWCPEQSISKNQEVRQHHDDSADFTSFIECYGNIADIVLKWHCPQMCVSHMWSSRDLNHASPTYLKYSPVYEKLAKPIKVQLVWNSIVINVFNSNSLNNFYLVALSSINTQSMTGPNGW